MSLINDALKRAKQAQTKTPPSVSAAPQLRPVETEPQTRRTPHFVLPLGILVLAGMGVIVSITQFHAHASRKTVAANNTAPASSSPVQVAPAQVSPPLVNSRPSVAAPSPATKDAGETVVFGPVSGGALEPKPATPQVNPGPPVASEKPAAGNPLKLTGIVFHPTHPAAMIGGKTLFVNDKVGEWQVVAINRESATLTHAGQTNVLSLAP